MSWILAAIVVFLSMFIPGWLVAYPFFKRFSRPLPEIAFWAIILGMIIPPVLAFLELFIGITYSAGLAWANIALVSVAGIVWIWKDGLLPKKFELPRFKFDIGQHWPWIALLGIALFAFFIRVQSISPDFYEFDPYYFQYNVQYIVTQGQVPPTDDTAWWPNISTHREPALTSYIISYWWSGYSAVTGTGYNNLTSAMVGAIYPPLVAALLAFCAFIFVREEYGSRWGVIAAALTAAAPAAIEKLSAGSQEIQPWGVFTIFLFLATYALAIKHGSRRYAALAGLAGAALVLGSRYILVLSLVFAGYVVLQSVADFLRKQDMWKPLQTNAIIFGFIAVAGLLGAAYRTITPIADQIATPLLVIAAALAFQALLHWAPKYIKVPRQWLLAGLLVIFVIAALLTPIGPKAVGYVQEAAGFAGVQNPLLQTVAENVPTGDDFQSGLGWLAIPGVNSPYPLLFFAAIALAYGVWRGSRLSLLFALAIFPVSYIGLHTSKYVLQLSLMIAVAFAVVLGELVLILGKSLQSEENRKTAATVVLGIGAVFALLQIGSPIRDSLDSSSQLYGYMHNLHIQSTWIDSMNWISQNVGPEERVLHWWDYGHWTNYFGQRKTVTRNEHQYFGMDLQVADGFVEGPLDHLTKFMRDTKAKYLLWDSELIGKWPALVYLSGVYNNCEDQPGKGWVCRNGFDWKQRPGLEKCLTRDRHWDPAKITTLCRYELEHVMEQLYVDNTGMCSRPDAPMRLQSSFGTTFCVSTQTGAMYHESSGKQMAEPKLVPIGEGSFLNLKPDLSWLTDQFGQSANLTSKTWDSPYVQGYFYDNLPGFTLVYPTNHATGDFAAVKIFKLLGPGEVAPVANQTITVTPTPTANATVVTNITANATPNATSLALP